MRLNNAWGLGMAQSIVRNIDEAIKVSLRLLVTRHGNSMGEEVRQILSAAAIENPDQPKKLGTWFATVFASEGLKKSIEEHRGLIANPANCG